VDAETAATEAKVVAQKASFERVRAEKP